MAYFFNMQWSISNFFKPYKNLFSFAALKLTLYKIIQNVATYVFFGQNMGPMATLAGPRSSSCTPILQLRYANSAIVSFNISIFVKTTFCVFVLAMTHNA
jgi:hypothetical protein